jgi:hypothetical protein
MACSCSTFLVAAVICAVCFCFYIAVVQILEEENVKVESLYDLSLDKVVVGSTILKSLVKYTDIYQQFAQEIWLVHGKSSLRWGSSFC